MKYFMLCIIMLFATKATAVGKEKHWSYVGKSGPSEWVKLNSEYSACDGKNQSPINLTKYTEAKLEPLTFSYSKNGSELINNGHTVQLNFSEGNYLSIDEERFYLKQFHFHSPSEHEINGRSFEMETHLVHSDKNGNLAVVALMINAGKSNLELEKLFSNLPLQVNNKMNIDNAIQPNKILPTSHLYYRYNGSLTTPPCTEGVRWFIIKEPITVSMQQIKAFKATISDANNRPTQAVGARLIIQ